jgi:hypothetical protein
VNIEVEFSFEVMGTEFTKTVEELLDVELARLRKGIFVLSFIPGYNR